MEKQFNTAGPVKQDKHYCVDPLSRWDLDHILSLIDNERYFILHAPRQTGKTSALLAMVDYLNNEGKYTALYVNVEPAQATRENVEAGMRVILSQLGRAAKITLKDPWVEETWPGLLERSGGEDALNAILSEWSGKNEKPIVLMIDEIDSLIGDTLISVLRQLRSGYTQRPAHFPQTIILCGVRDIRDYRIHVSSSKEIITGGSAFNIKAESLRMGNFTKEDIRELYNKHTEATGQQFGDEVWDQVWHYTGGQPWLVNALAHEAVYNMRENRDRSVVITSAIMEEAKERLILRRDTHIDQLGNQLKESRVRRVIQPLLEGSAFYQSIPDDDIQYCIDLGLVHRNERGTIDVANAIYREIIPRQLTWSTEVMMDQPQQWYVNHDGSLNMEKLLSSFQDFFREHSEHWVEGFNYQEAGPQLLLQAYLQRIVNGGGIIIREYGLGRKRTDLYIKWKVGEGIEKFVLELKLLRKSREKTLTEGLEQTAMYMDKCGAKTGHLMIFDRGKDRSWEEKIFREKHMHEGKEIEVWGC